MTTSFSRGLYTTMWVTTASQTSFPTPILFTPFLSFSKLPQLPSETYSTVQLQRSNRLPAVVAAASSSSQDIGGLGQAVLSTLKSGPSTGSNPSKKVQQEEQPNKGKEISGSDILRALQKASAKKASTKKQHKKNGSGDLKREKNGKKVVDYDKVRPITVKSDWATRLNDLEKRLQEFSSL